MDPQLAQQLRPLFISRPIKYAALFGSQARGDASRDSDYDILIDFTPEYPYSLLDIADVKIALEETLHRPVDVVTMSAASPKLLQLIQQELQPIYGHQ